MGDADGKGLAVQPAWESSFADTKHFGEAQLLAEKQRDGRQGIAIVAV